MKFHHFWWSWVGPVLRLRSQTYGRKSMMYRSKARICILVWGPTSSSELNSWISRTFKICIRFLIKKSVLRFCGFPVHRNYSRAETSSTSHVTIVIARQRNENDFRIEISRSERPPNMKILHFQISRNFIIFHDHELHLTSSCARKRMEGNRWFLDQKFRYTS